MNNEHNLTYRSADGDEVVISLDQAPYFPFESVTPFRFPPSYRKQKNLPGLYWFETTGRHVCYESLLEMRTLQELDYDPEVVAVAAQPFRMTLPKKCKPRRHVPDFFARLVSGAGRVVEVKPARIAGSVDVRRALRSAAKLCAGIGWDYEVRTEPDAIVDANLSWLAGFRRKPAAYERFADSLVEAAAAGAAVSDILHSHEQEALVRPVLFHLMWKRVLAANLHAPLCESTVVTASGRT